MQEIIKQLQELLRNYLENEKICLTQDTLLTADLGLNSYDLAMLIFEVEDHFGVEIPDRAMAEIMTAGDLARILVQH